MFSTPLRQAIRDYADAERLLATVSDDAEDERQRTLLEQREAVLFERFLAEVSRAAPCGPTLAMRCLWDTTAVGTATANTPTAPNPRTGTTSSDLRNRALAAAYRVLWLTDPDPVARRQPDGTPAGMLLVHRNLDALVEIARRTTCDSEEAVGLQVLQDICDRCPNQQPCGHCTFRHAKVCTLYRDAYPLTQAIAGILQDLGDRAYLDARAGPGPSPPEAFMKAAPPVPPRTYCSGFDSPVPPPRCGPSHPDGRSCSSSGSNTGI